MTHGPGESGAGSDGDDDLDPSDWLASQFGEEPEPVVPADAAAPEPPTIQLPSAESFYSSPSIPVTPAEPRPPVDPPAAPPAPQPPVEPSAPPYTAPPSYVVPMSPPTPLPSQEPYSAPAEPAPPAATFGGGSGGFSWGLTPGGGDAEPAAAAEPLAPEPTPPVFAEPAALPPATTPFVAAPVEPLVVPSPTAPPFTPPPVVPSTEPPTTAFSAFEDVSTVAMSAAMSAPEPLPTEVVPWHAAPLDPAPVDAALAGATEALGVELVGLPVPENEGVATSAIDSLFGDSSFRDYEGEPLIAPLPSRASGGTGGGGDGDGPRAPKPPRATREPLPRTQRILMWVAGGLVALLALVALYLVGTRISDAFGPAPAVSPSATPSASPTPEALPIGPLPVGEYQWDELLGGECLDPFESAWQDRYTVMNCTAPHPAQMVYRGVFVDTPETIYPGMEELQKRINLLCTTPAVIDYAAAGTVLDIQVTASFAVDAESWDDGNRDYFCFANRSGGEPLTASIAVPQVAPVPVAPETPVPTESAPPAPRGKGGISR